MLTALCRAHPALPPRPHPLWRAPLSSSHFPECASVGGESGAHAIPSWLANASEGVQSNGPQRGLAAPSPSPLYRREPPYSASQPVRTLFKTFLTLIRERPPT